MARVPRRLPGAAVEGLSPELKHLLATVDGSLDQEELAFVVGMSPEQTERALDQLMAQGLVTFAELEVEDRRAIEPPPRQVTADGIDLGADERVAIDALLELVTSGDYYRMLGLPRDATTKQIKTAYYKTGPRYHPDRYFSRSLGPYKHKIETIFSRLTKAHDTLRYSKRRDAYDSSLPPLKPGDRIPHAPRPSDPGPQRGSEPDLGRVSSAGPSPAGPPTSPRPPVPSDQGVPSTAPPRSSVPGPPPASVPPRASDPGGAPSRPSVARGPRIHSSVRKRDLSPEEIKAQRELIARKLRASISPPVDPMKQPAPTTEPKTGQRASDSLPPSQEVGRSAAEKIRDRFDHAVGGIRERRLQRYLETGRVAMLAGDFRAATAAFEQAQRICPDDPEIAEKVNEAARRAKSG